MNRQYVKQDLPVLAMHATLRQLVESTKDVATFAALSHGHTRFLSAALLASIMTSDERAHTGDLLLHSDIMAFGLYDLELENMALELRHNLSLERRVELVSLLWKIALGQNEHSPDEDERIQEMTQFVGVTGLRALAEKMNAAAGQRS